MTADHTQGGAFNAATEDTPFKLVAMLSPGQPEARLGERVARARTHYKLTVEALSRLTKSIDRPEGRGISPPSIARYEANAGQPGARELRLLAQALSVPTDWLIYGHTGTAGSSDVEQQLIDLLRRFVAEQNPENNFGKAQADVVASLKEDEWRRALQEARKPS